MSTSAPAGAESKGEPPVGGASGLWPRLGLLFALLYLFLIAIKLLSGAIKMMGAGTADSLFDGVTHPIAALSVGLLATVLVQSSSVTTSTIVGLVGSGVLDVVTAVPMIMGANIGTTITNTLVSLCSVRRRKEFGRAFAAATVHDFFNILAVAVFLPLQLWTGFLSRFAHTITSGLQSMGVVGEVGGTYQSPIKKAVGAGSDLVKHFVTETLGLEGSTAGVVLLLIGIAAIFFSLTLITRMMRKVIVDKAEQALNAALRKSGVFAILIGAAVTMAVQSSSITTSLMVPLCAAGILTLENAFPVMLGANIGTTITAFLASLATDVAGLEIALVHVQFNVLATALVFPFERLRAIPIGMARYLAKQAVRNKIWVGGYVFVMFVGLPVTALFIFR